MYGEKTFDGKHSTKALCEPPEVSTILGEYVLDKLKLEEENGVIER